ncbi:hypothetical protein [Couchioplanes caeruleus]|uniref:Uncharacterized protein n=2 Tax=Couchioplanes caeruleus TaxID=56438 RepID=A0A1K0FIW5_9ACTN|nr:hypothetical protein [Couchioplanes caeruleus]OJF12781.1 hypothetical protein BG844_18815 [Couchioplanes caeruleus subsp. caeruleus]ROP29427.1 hypothetical protein EDD30_2221 [Couchioplanes caeruleus]
MAENSRAHSGTATTSRITDGEPILLACPAVDSASLRCVQGRPVERERALDGAAVLTRDTATGEDAAQSFDPDLVTVLTLVDVLMSALGVERGAPGSARVAGDLVDAVYAHALVVPHARLSPAPVAAEPPSRDGAGPLTVLLRTAVGVSREGPPTWEEAQELCGQVVSRALSSLGMNQQALTWMLGKAAPAHQDDPPDPEAEGQFDNAADEFWSEPDDDAVDPAMFETEPDPPETDPWIVALIAAAGPPTAPGIRSEAAAGAAPPPKTLRLLRPLSRLNWKRLLKFGLPAAKRAELNAWVRERRSAGEIRRHSPTDGFIAERTLLALYLLDRKTVAENILAGFRVGDKTLSDVAAADSLWETVRTALLSVVTGAVGQPDILDPALRHVYEIKPKAQAVRGAKQLYGRYLLFLNAWEIFNTVDAIPARRALAWSAKVLAEFARFVTRPVPDHVDLSKIGPVRFWEPGSWTPPRRVLLWDGRVMDVEVPIPGVLCYQILGSRKDDDSAAGKPVDERDISLTLLGLVLAHALADAARQTGGPAGVEALARAAGDHAANGEDMAGWLAGAAAVGAGTLAATKLWEALSPVAKWLAVLAQGAGRAATSLTAPFVFIDPETGAPLGLQERFRTPQGV